MRVVGEFGPDEIRVRASRARMMTAVFLLALAGVPVLVMAASPDVGAFLLYVTFLLIVAVMAFVAWVKWFHAVHDIVVAVDKARFRGQWWVWAWLIPGVNWIVPKMMLNDLWNAARSAAGPRTQPLLVNVWWGFYAASGVILYMARDDRHPLLEAIGYGAMFVAYAMSLWVVPKITEVALLTQDAYQRASIEPPSTGITQPVT